MKKNVKNGYRIGMVSIDELISGNIKRIKLSKEMYSLGDALEIINKAKFPCILCDHIGTPVSL
jgi:hypothetical protein